MLGPTNQHSKAPYYHMVQKADQDDKNNNTENVASKAGLQYNPYQHSFPIDPPIIPKSFVDVSSQAQAKAANTQPSAGASQPEAQKPWRQEKETQDTMMLRFPRKKAA